MLIKGLDVSHLNANKHCLMFKRDSIGWCVQANIRCVQKGGNVRKSATQGPCFRCASSKLRCVPSAPPDPKDVKDAKKGPPAKKRKTKKSPSEINTDDESRGEDGM